MALALGARFLGADVSRALRAPCAGVSDLRCPRAGLWVAERGGGPAGASFHGLGEFPVLVNARFLSGGSAATPARPSGLSSALGCLPHFVALSRAGGAWRVAGISGGARLVFLSRAHRNSSAISDFYVLFCLRQKYMLFFWLVFPGCL